MPEPANQRAMRFTRTVAFRLFLLIASVATVVLIVFTIVAVRVQQENLIDQVLADSDRLSNVITRSTRHSMLLNKKEDVQNIILSIGGEPGIEGIRIYNKEGDITFATDEEELLNRVDMSAEACVACHPDGRLENALPLGSQRSRIFTKPDGERVIGLITPIRNEKSCSDAECHAHASAKTVLGVLDVKMSLEKLDEELEESASRLILVSIGAVIGLSIASGMFIRKVVHNPVHQLITGMKQVASGKLNQSIRVDHDNEVGELAHQFNKMTIELEKARSELTAWSETLEKRVKEKTKELEAAHNEIVHIEKMASLGSLSASVAHELNNPLEGILTFSRLLIKRIKKLQIPDDIAGEFTKDLTLVAEESQRCGSIVKNLLLFARKGSGTMQTIRLRPVLERCLALTNHHAQINNVRMEIRCPENLDVECDADELEQVLLALSVNAIEAMSGPGVKDGGGLLTITVNTSEDGGWVTIHVRDTGVGMSEEIKGHIFEPFFTTKSQGKGTGLGLSLVYGIVNRHQGSVAVESAPGKGSHFTVTLPSRQSPERTEYEHSYERKGY